MVIHRFHLGIQDLTMTQEQETSLWSEWELRPLFKAMSHDGLFFLPAWDPVQKMCASLNDLR